LSFELKDLVHRDDVARVLRPLLVRFKAERQPGESLGDYCQRLGPDVVRGIVAPEYSI
jgi:sulfite reductase beta subunit-like hemoprotein